MGVEMKLNQDAKTVPLPVNYEPGWNVIIYNSDNVSIDDLYAGLRDSEVLIVQECESLPGIIEQNTFIDLPFYYEQKKAERLIESLRNRGVHCEVLYQQINEFNIDKLKRLFIHEHVQQMKQTFIPDEEYEDEEN
jgi:hypothetical protein